MKGYQFMQLGYQFMQLFTENNFRLTFNLKSKSVALFCGSKVLNHLLNNGLNPVFHFFEQKDLLDVSR
jgi:hypothetical protein